MGRSQKYRSAAFLAAASLLIAACDPLDGRIAPDTANSAAGGNALQVGPSAESRALRSYYTRLENDLSARGLLRTDGGGPDTPYGARTLSDNFMQIALFDEYTTENGRVVARQTASRLRRWEGPVRVQVTFGPGVQAERRNADITEVDRVAARLSSHATQPVRRVSSGGNMHVLILNEDERLNGSATLSQLIPDISPIEINTILQMPRSIYCLAYAFSDPRDPEVYRQALIIIRDEHPSLLRRSCIHEEMAQAMGLANDSPQARPSIFNDDEEFALLTSHDDLLLQILYDRRLTPGMSAAEARPIVETIATELVGGES
ncbi:MAG: DUF2927 domain-containing protein [Pseudomonadota bacterium]